MSVTLQTGIGSIGLGFSLQLLPVKGYYSNQGQLLRFYLGDIYGRVYIQHLSAGPIGSGSPADFPQRRLIICHVHANDVWGLTISRQWNRPTDSRPVVMRSSRLTGNGPIAATRPSMPVIRRLLKMIFTVIQPLLQLCTAWLVSKLCSLSHKQLGSPLTR